MGYNEPDFVDQSNVPVATAIANQHYFTNSGMRIGAPATAIQAPNSEWFNEYLQGINTDDIDFIPVHNYPGNIGVTDKEIKDNAKSLLNCINETHNKFNKPIWVTEFAVANWNPYWDGYNGANEANKAEVRKFLNYVINGFDNNVGLNDLEFVERYAWFSFDALVRYGGDSGLFNTKADHDKNSMLKIGTLTTLGNDYRNLGNPEGYILPNLMGEIEPSIEDEYVDDYVNVMINGRSENVVLGSKFDKIDTPVKDGYVFSGWYSDEACTKEYDFDSIVTDNVTIYPKWLKMHTVTIDGIDNKVIDGNTAVKPLPSVKDGYVFKGWYSDSEYNMEEEETSTSSVNNDSEYISDEEQDSSKDGDYILEGSDSRYITEKEVENLSEAERRLAKNEIYARHGRMFDSADLQDYFESKSWYKGTVKPSDFDESVLNKYEKANIDLISSME